MIALSPGVKRPLTSIESRDGNAPSMTPTCLQWVKPPKDAQDHNGPNATVLGFVLRLTALIRDLGRRVMRTRGLLRLLGRCGFQNSVSGWLDGVEGTLSPRRSASLDTIPTTLATSSAGESYLGAYGHLFGALRP